MALPSESEGEEEEALFEDEDDNEEEEEEFHDDEDDDSNDSDDDEGEGTKPSGGTADLIADGDEEDEDEDSDYEVSPEEMKSVADHGNATLPTVSASAGSGDMMASPPGLFDDPPAVRNLQPAATASAGFSLFDDTARVVGTATSTMTAANQAENDLGKYTRDDLLRPFLGDAHIVPLTNEQAWVAATSPTFDTSRIRRPFILHDAAESGNLHLLQQIFARDPTTGEGLPLRDLRIDQRDLDGCNALQVALLNGNLQCAKVLVENGAEINYRCEGNSLAHLVIAMGAYTQYRSRFVIEALKFLIEHGADVNTIDDLGRTPLHLAAQLDLSECIEILISTRQSVELTPDVLASPASRSILRNLGAFDKDGNTAAQIAALNHSYSSLRILYEYAPESFGHANKYGWTPLHTACYTAAVRYPGARTDAELIARSPVIALLAKQAGLSFAKADLLGRTPMDWYVRNNGMLGGPNQQKYPPALIAWSKECLVHFTATAINRRKGPPPPENVRRLRVLFDPRGGCLRIDEFGTGDPALELASAADDVNPLTPGVRLPILSGALAIEWLSSARRAAIADVLRCHEFNYVTWLRSKANALQISAAEALNAARALNPTAQLQGPSHSFALSGDDAPKGIPAPLAYLDGDTTVSPASYPASMAAAGLVCDAIDRVVLGHNRVAFCAVRPPGHHAGPTGVVHADVERTGSSHGFCLINNVAIGAAYARCVHRHRGIRRIAIVDFDVHHGNGTEAIVRNLAPTTIMQKFHGDLEEFVVVRKQCYKPWLDESDPHEVLFASVHGLKGQNDEWIYPGSGATSEGIVEAVDSRAVDPDALPENFGVDDGKYSPPDPYVPYEDETATSATAYSKYRPPGYIRPQIVPGMESHILNVGIPANRPVCRWRQAWRHAIIPALLKHKPDLIIISAGFDAHKRDSINLGHIGVDEADFYWITKQLVKVANTVCQGRIVSVLEGGYRIHGKVVSPFGRSVAAHVRALSEGCGETWDPEFAKLERDLEDQELAQAALAKRLEMEQQMRATGLFTNPPSLGPAVDATSIPVEPVHVPPANQSVPMTSGNSAPSQSVADSSTSVTTTDASMNEIGYRRNRRNKEPVDYIAFAQEFEERCKRAKLEAEKNKASEQV